MPRRPLHRPRFRIDDEGVTKYRLEYHRGKRAARGLIREINAWRGLFFRLGWIGQDPSRYRGVGFGNVSRRIGGTGGQPRFVISGTQTGNRHTLSPAHFTVVEKSFPKENRVIARGPCPPSSESMTHAVVYRLDPTAQVVIHVHAPLLWKQARRLGLPQTGRFVPYGTPEMAAEVERLFKTHRLQSQKIFSMAGHKDGVVSFGRTAEEAALRLIFAAVAVFSLKHPR